MHSGVEQWGCHQRGQFRSAQDVPRAQAQVSQQDGLSSSYKAREHSGDLKKIIISQPSSRAARDWLVENITGLGMKEASHFLRNVGYLDLAIIDKHILTTCWSRASSRSDLRR